MAAEQVSKHVQQLEEAFVRADSSQSKIDALNNLAWKLRISQHERALALSKEAAELSRTGEYAAQAYRLGLAASLITRAFLDSENGNLDTAISRCYEALSLLENQHPFHLLIDAWYTLGWTYFYLGDHPTAYNYGLKALNLARELGLQDREAWALDAVASFGDDTLHSIQMHEKALQIFKDIDDVDGQYRVLNNWACVLSDQGNIDAALEVAHQGLQLVRKHSLKREEINLSETIGEILLAKGEYAQAHEYLQNAQSISDICGNDIGYVYVLVSLGQVYLAQNELEKAEQQLNFALTTSIQWNIRSEQMRCHQYLSEVYKEQGKFEKALEHYKLFHSFKESVAGESAARQIAMLKMSYQIETTQRDAEIQRLQNVKLQLEIEEQKRVQAILENLATRDSLTNLYNRRHFLSLAKQEWKRASRYKSPLTALMLDIDQFKQINDRYGHATGDHALLAVAGIIQSTLRTSEIAGRYGGDEFAIILPETSAKNGLYVSKRISNEIIDEAIQTETGPITLTVSIGVAGLSDTNRGHIQTLEALLNRADKALYEAKRAGKNQTYLFPGEE